MTEETNPTMEAPAVAPVAPAAPVVAKQQAKPVKATKPPAETPAAPMVMVTSVEEAPPLGTPDPALADMGPATIPEPEVVGEVLHSGTLAEMAAGKLALAAHAHRAGVLRQPEPEAPPAPAKPPLNRDPNWVPGFSNTSNPA